MQYKPIGETKHCIKPTQFRQLLLHSLRVVQWCIWRKVLVFFWIYLCVMRSIKHHTCRFFCCNTSSGHWKIWAEGVLLEVLNAAYILASSGPHFWDTKLFFLLCCVCVLSHKVGILHCCSQTNWIIGVQAELYCHV